MLQFKQCALWVVVILLISCCDSGNVHHAKKINSIEHLSELTKGWDVNQSSGYAFEISHSEGVGLKTGEPLFFEFAQPRHIDFIEFVYDTQGPIFYKIYLDNKYAGKAEVNQKIGIRKKVRFS